MQKTKNRYHKLTTLLVLFMWSAFTYAATLTSITSGNWDKTSTWDTGTLPSAGDNVIIAAGHTVKLKNDEYCFNITINSTAVLDDNGNRLYVLGNLMFNGDWIGGGRLYILGAGSTIDGVGTVTSNGRLRIETGTVTVLPTCNLVFPNVKIDFRTQAELINKGTISVRRIKGRDNSSVWINDTGGILRVQQDLFKGPAKGILIATAINNTVNYDGTGKDQSVFPTTYYNFTVNKGGAVAWLLGNIIVTNNFNIITGTFDTTDPIAGNSFFDVNIGGNWNNTDVFNANTSTVTFDGTGAQSIANAAGEIFYDLVINKSAGMLSLANNVAITNRLTMTSGNVDALANLLTLGTGTGNVGILNYTTGTIIGQFKRWVNTTATDVLFPLGDATTYRPATLNYTNLTAGAQIVKFVATNPGANGLPLTENGLNVIAQYTEGYWSLTAANGLASSNYSVALTATNFTSHAINAATRAVYRSNSASAYNLLGTHQLATDPIIYRTGLNTATGEFAIGHTDCAPPATSSITGSISVCKNQTAVIYSVANTSGSTYAWSITGGTQASGGNTSSIMVDWGTVGGTGIVAVVETAAAGCSPGAAVNLSVTVNPIVQSITGAVTSCNGSTETYSAIANSGSTYTWGITGGTQVSGGTTNTINVLWNTGGTGSISVTETTASCGMGATAIQNVQIGIVSAASGNWDSPGTWVGGVIPGAADCATIQTGHTVALAVKNTFITNLEVQTGGVLDDAGKRLYCSGNLILNGDWIGGGRIHLTGTNTSIDGVSVISGKGRLRVEAGTKTVLATANISMLSNKSRFDIRGGATLDNLGTISVFDIKGRDNSSKWINSTNSVLKVANKVMTGVGKGILEASATGNTVTYNGAGANQDVYPTTYYNLSIDNTTGIALLTGNTSATNNFTITSGIFDTEPAFNFSLNVGGNWSNAGTFNGNLSTVTLNGAGNQAFSNALGTELFYNLTINKSGGSVIMASNIDVSNGLAMTAGNVTTGANLITLGTSTANTGALTYTAGTIIGKFQRWVATTATNIIFPVGTATNTNRLTTNFTNLTAGSLIAEFIATDPGVTGLPLVDVTLNVTNQFTEGYWKTTAIGGLASTNYNLSLDGIGFTSYTISPPTRVIKRITAGAWTMDGVHGNATGTAGNRTAMNGITAEFGLGQTNCTSPATSAIAGSNSACINQIGTIYSVVNTPLSTYTWTINGGVQANGGNTNSITVDWGAIGTTSATVQVVETVTCGTGTPVVLTVTVGPSTDTIIGAAIVAANSNGVTYSVVNTVGSTYTWTITGGVLATGAGTNSITVNFGAAGTGNVSVIETSGTCGAGSPVNLPISILPTFVTKQSGNWTKKGTWQGGVVPSATDFVEIVAGHTVFMDGAPTACYGLIVNGTAMWVANGDQTDVGLGGITVNAGGDITDVNKAGILTTTGGLVLNTTTSSTALKVYVQITPNQIISGTGSISELHIDATTTNTGTLSVNRALFGISTLTNAANASLTLGGTVNIVNLVASASGNTVIYNSTSAQIISDFTPFYNLTLNNAAGVSTLTPISILNLLTLSQGNLTLNDTLTLVSSVSNTASIAIIPATSAITGKVTMQRYLNGTNGWKSLANCIVGGTMADWGDDIYNSWAFSYNETKFGVLDSGWVGALATSASIAPGKGILAYTYAGVSTLDVTGTVNQGNFNFGITYTNDPLQPASQNGWNLLGNPYPSTMDWDAAGWTKTNINGAVYVWDGAAQQFTSYVGGVGTNGGTNLIASSQAFWVQSVAASPVLSATEAVKSNASATFFKAKQQETLKIKIAGSAIAYTDETLLVLDENATSIFDGNYDAVKFYSSNPSVPSIATQDSIKQAYSINSFKQLNSDMTIPLQVKVGITGTYEISFSGIANMGSVSCLKIEDLFTGTIQSLVKDTTYSYNFSDTTNVPRFLLHVGASPLATTQSVSCFGVSDGKITVAVPSNGPWDFYIKNENGMVLSKAISSNNGYQMDSISSGNYTLEMINSNGICKTYSSVISVTTPFELTPNINTIPPHCIGVNNGAISVIPEGGVSPYNYKWNTSSTFSTINNLTKGKYSVTVTDANNCLKTEIVSITNSQIIDIQESIIQPICYGESNGSINLILQGGVAPYNYKWSNNNKQNQLVNIVSGTYSVTITDKDGCVNSMDYNVAQPNEMIIEFNIPDTVFVEEMFTATNISLGATSYYWSFGEGADSFSESPVISYVNPGLYQIDLGAFNGNCEIHNIKSIVVLPATSATNVQSLQNITQRVTVMPNPVAKGQIVSLKLTDFTSSEKILVIVRDITGKEYYSKIAVTSLGGEAIIAIDMNAKLASGIYIITGTSDNYLFNKRLVVR